MDDIETIPPGEAAGIQRVVAALEVLLSLNQSKSGWFVADVYMKMQGYAQGEVPVLPNLPGEIVGHDAALEFCEKHNATCGPTVA